MKGYAGKVLLVDLSAGVSEVLAIEDRVYESVLSGVGLGAWYLCGNIPPGADPLGPDNILGFTAGLLTGTGSVMTGRWMAVCKSPLTGGWGDSNCGGNLAPAIKQCGFDAIFIKGISGKPVYLYVDNKGAVIEDASAYWGLDAVEAEERLIKDTWKGKKPAVAVIGPAGEKLSLISGISNDLGRYAARSGVGAVMGSKRLKALVLAGAKAMGGADPVGMRRLSVEYANKVRKSNIPGFMKGSIFPLMGKLMGRMKNAAPMDGMLTSMLLKKFGTSMNDTLAVTNGDAPLKNWGGSSADYSRRYYRAINPDRVIRREKRKYHCYSCIVGCGGICDISDLGKGEYDHTHKPEYETIMAFSGLLMIKDLDAVFYINELLNRAGFDTISAGSSVAFAIECYENGILTKEDSGGIELRWGDAKAVIALVGKMIARDGLGDILADGVKSAAARIGKGSERFAIHAGGQELPMHDPKIDPMLGVVYSADPTPGRHTTSGGLYYSTSFLWDSVSWLPPFKAHPKSDDFVPTEGGSLANKAQTCFKMLLDGSGACYYAMLMGTRHFKIFEYLNLATGWKKTADEYMDIGARIQTLRQHFNAIQGADPRAFLMHDRAAGKPALNDGHNKGVTLRVDEMIPLYWKSWGWDEATGLPTEETLRALGLRELLESESNHG
ncbi:MAG: aldehyde ferredoxin oxidoreductase C-terminal domain-containing protein [Spirochaetaceae bacterium]|nr:aldehyde ferredoxin oxidoreductase C-terminal domain-containing protein [Spirochaetaceae bacterium]